MRQRPVPPSFVFFGTPQEAVWVLDALEGKGFLPSLVVSSPDRPVGRHQTMTPPPAKAWAAARNIPVLQPEKITADATAEIAQLQAPIYIVAAYGKILPQHLLDSAPKGVLNVHPSLLPLYRGPAPIEGPILSGDEETGVTIMLLDKDVDHGPIIDQEFFPLDGNETAPELSQELFARGGELLAEILPEWLEGTLEPQEQDHDLASFTRKMKKEDGEVSLSDDPLSLWRKFRAYQPWPGIFFFEDGKRIKITEAKWEDDTFVPLSVVPEGQKKVPYSVFVKNIAD